jgi:hypothetical protein
MSRAHPKSFGQTTANLASGSFYKTAQLLSQDAELHLELTQHQLPVQKFNHFAAFYDNLKWRVVSLLLLL